MNGQKIELTIEKMPQSFSLIDKGGMVFLVLYYITWDDIYVEPARQEMIVSYRLLKDRVETKKGTISVEDRNRERHVKMFTSVKKNVWAYLDEYNTNIQSMSREVIDQLISEL